MPPEDCTYRYLMKANQTPSSVVRRVALTALGLVCVHSSLQAQIHIDRVYVGYSGNVADSNGRGAVGYDYQIGTYEVTNAQYVAFLNAVATTADPYGLYTEEMTNAATGGIIRTGTEGSYSYTSKEGHAYRPVTHISWYNAARFANWYHNGQGNSDTETGAYTLNGAMNGIFTRNEDALVALPTADEWYKAAYYDPTRSGGTPYWLFATQSDVAPIGVAPNGDNANSGNLGGNPIRGTTDIGSYLLAQSYYGTFDQAGNVIEYTEAFVEGGSLFVQNWGGDYDYGGIYTSAHDSGNNPLLLYPSHYNSTSGFRLYFAAIPEPSTYLLIGFGVGALLLTRKKRPSLPTV